jgi:hypothetical protein
VSALKGAGTALEAVAAGIVTVTNVRGTGIIRLGTARDAALLFRRHALNTFGAGISRTSFASSAR